MAKWYGIVGIADDIETEPGFHEDSIVEKHYQGDIISTRWRRQTTDRINDDITLAKQISIIADQYALYHYSTIAYVEYRSDTTSVFGKNASLEIFQPAVTAGKSPWLDRKSVV